MEHNKQNPYLDFVQRTKEIISQYESFLGKQETKEKYEVTLLINCFVGLVLTPKEILYEDLKTEGAINKETWGISPNEILCSLDINKKENKSVYEITRHLRNSVSHCNFETFSNKEKVIDRICFKDEFKETPTFESTINIADLKKFALKLADYFISKQETLMSK
jgi:hypothetical protein